ncbi:myosin-IIIb-like [Pomacea canaliculata]|uniref:myosin-IIIb-like n=1 Tax=Pomacea canaliculata TaxID=400727 RepID=UPI000D7391B2|nr:myosin-IIIb-like [Pomacea canaliculata]
MNGSLPGEVEDLATLVRLDEQILLGEIKERYTKNRIYTYVGDILIAVNPFRDLGVYGKEVSAQYRMAKRSSQPPHIFAVADAAYQALLGLGGRAPSNQCILISGESGAGKTESTKLIIKQLVELCRGNTQLERQILQVNPLLEAFGNAQTVMNDNSSRFGKYIQLRFSNGHLAGAKISEYLLEKSRVVRQANGEENFHIFSYIFAGAQHVDEFALRHPSQYRYMSQGAPQFSDNLSVLHERYEDLLCAMDMVGFTDEEQQDMFTVISGVLHLGNITFGVDDTDAAVVIDPNGAVKIASKLLGVDSEDVTSCLTSIITVTKGEYLKRNYSLSQAEDARDAMAKAVYGRLFGWIVNKVNQLLAPEAEIDPSKMSEIGILDIFGFENFQKNSFEQACINLANEQLQFFFNKHIFQLEQEEYTKEGIDWNEIKFVDNKPLLELFLVKPLGILALLDEESLFPKGTDQSYVDKLNANFGKNPYYGKSPRSNNPVFSISHYAGKVTYDTFQWLEKNRDTLPAGITESLQLSSNRLVKTVFRGQITRTGSLALQGRTITGKTVKSRRAQIISSAADGAKRKITVGAQFKTSLGILMERMTSATPSFVRCLKPNHHKRAGSFDDQYILSQLLYTGMLETTKIRREGFAIRPSFEEFVDRYKILLCQLTLKGSRDNCMKILQASRMSGWHIGKTKVFLKYWHVERLAELLENLGKSAIVLQKVVRGFLARRRCARIAEEARRQRQLLEALMRAAEEASLASEKHLETLREQRDNKARNTTSNTTHPSAPDFPHVSPGYASPGDPKQRRQRRALEHRIPTATVNIIVWCLCSWSSYRHIFALCVGYIALEGSSTAIQLHIIIVGEIFIRQMEFDDSSDPEVIEDDFKPVSSNLNKFGREGTKHAAQEWFKETQTHNVYDSSAGKFAEWFHGIISRKESERLLKDKIIGCFLIRVSESRFGYSLSFKDRDRCRHYMIDQLKNGKFIIIGESKVHRTLPDLVQFHKKVRISNWDGVLTVPCGQEQGECDYIDLVDDNLYFVLEDGKDEVQMPSPHAPHTGLYPPLPPRMYSLSQDVHPGGRPLPKIPEESYNRLMKTQNEQPQHDPKSQKFPSPRPRRK